MSVRKREFRRGVVAVLVAFIIVVLFAMVAFAIDVGFIVHARTELQRTADVCAFAAVAQLPDRDAARGVAQARAIDNYGTVGSDLRLSDIEFGYWDRDAATLIQPTPTNYTTNAVRVTLRRTEASGNPLVLFFAQLMGSERADVTATATAMYDRNLCGPFVGIQWVSVPGSPTTDSYSSTEGPYQEGSARDRGSLCSDGPIFVDGAAYIRGDARAGKNHHVHITGNATVTGSIGARLKPLNMPPVDATEAALNNDNAQVPMIPEGNSWRSPVDSNGNFLLDGTRTIDLPPGTYYFNDFTLKGQATFNVSGPTRIYVTGNLERAGGVVVNNSTQKPGNLQFLMTGGTANVTSENNFYATIYAPNTNVTIDGASDLYGAVVGKTLTITGSGEGHYDEALSAGNMPFPRRTSLVD